MATAHQTRFSLRALANLLKVTTLLVVGAFLQKFVPMTRWGHLLGTPGKPDRTSHSTSETTVPPEVLALEKSLRQGVRLLPFTPSCLAQAFAGQRMLISKDIPSTVTIGLRQEGTHNWPAHAWLHAGNRVITGGGVGEVYFPTTSYRWAHASTAPETPDPSDKK